MRWHVVVLAVLAGLGVLGGCQPVLVVANPRHPSPRWLWPRPVETVPTYQARPPNGVAVFDLEAAGENEAEVERAIRRKAARLGCDGIMFTVRAEQSTSAGVELTGKLNSAREYENAHIDALCMVDPAALPAGCPAPRPESKPEGKPEGKPDVTPAAEIDRAVRATLEQWRLGYEQRNGEVLAALYAHDASLRIVADGNVLHGWAAFEPVLSDQLARATAIHVELADIQIDAAGQAAIVTASMRRVRADDTTTQTEDGVVTLVLRAPATGAPSAAAGWHIVAEHTSARRSDLP